jgi:hypothetical protein
MTVDGSWTVEPPRRRRTLLFVGAAVAMVGGLAAVSAVALTSSNKASGFPTGAGTATITWQPTRSTNSSAGPPTPFTGTIAGIPVNGDSTPTPLRFNGSTPGIVTTPARLPLARWTGTFEGKPFDLDVALANTGTGLANASVDVRGTYGAQPVHMTAPFSVSQANLNSIAFSGTIGRYHVTGTVRPTGGSPSNTAQASFVVTG